MNNGFTRDWIVVAEHTRYYLRKKQKNQVETDSLQQVIPDSEEDEADSVHSVYTPDSDAVSDGWTGSHHKGNPPSTGKRAKRRLDKTFQQPAAAAAANATQLHENDRRHVTQEHPFGVIRATALPTEHGAGRAQGRDAPHSGFSNSTAVGDQRSMPTASVKQTITVGMVPAPVSGPLNSSSSRGSQSDASPRQCCSTRTAPVTGSQPHSRAQTSPVVDPKQTMADTASLQAPVSNTHSRLPLQHADAQTDPIHLQQPVAQCDAQASRHQLLNQHAGTEALHSSHTSAALSLYTCAALAGACKHASLSTAAQLGLVSAYLCLTTASQLINATAAEKQQKATDWQCGGPATAVVSRQQAAGQSPTDISTTVSMDQQKADAVTDAVPVSNAVAIPSCEAQTLSRLGADCQERQQGVYASACQVQ